MTNRLVLIAIATGLWANVITSLVRPAHADADSYLSNIAHDTHALVYGGSGCFNSKIC
ncbi:hypothetical protein J4G48_0006320 [Bradyrhizobium barranii subsp. apii]|uniref:hypothetical protein n=1 Tax=Bradyrhizobium barranii TaxID=2992140 RepID=UPI001AA0C40C|nr:hypothetical protein [Bradyrhizobium barranii]UPT97714.1 hypothetical protein J4G48_0006320 [Bradyrhizobium barranii subsp. apii]